MSAVNRSCVGMSDADADRSFGWDKDKQGHPRQPEHVYKLVFLCRPVGGELSWSHETDGADYFSPDELPPMCPYRNAPHYVQLAFEHLAEPGRPTLFD